MGNFDEFYDQQRAAHEAELKKERNDIAEEQRKEKERIEKLSEPLTRCYGPVISLAVKELSSRGIEIQLNPSVSMTVRSVFINSTYFRLSLKRNDRGYDMSSTYGFGVCKDGVIQSLVVEDGSSLKIIYSTSPESFGQYLVQELIHTAVKDLVSQQKYI